MHNDPYVQDYLQPLFTERTRELVGLTNLSLRTGSLSKKTALHKSRQTQTVSPNVSKAICGEVVLPHAFVRYHMGLLNHSSNI